MRRTIAVVVLAFIVIAVPFYMTARTSGRGPGTQHSAQPLTPSAQPGSMTGSAAAPRSPSNGRTYGVASHTSESGAEDARGFDFGWLGLLGLAGLLGLRHTPRNTVVTL